MAANSGPHAEMLAIEDRTEPLAGISRHARLTAGPSLWWDGITAQGCFEAACAIFDRLCDLRSPAPQQEERGGCHAGHTVSG
ncbi:hypothetical protein [Methylobacterium nodulans]|uniref:Uncharacterized protein n=1 Tax=Methylobacterium nodulans (strain LMG 21967 / CNCM I-2342 / ORS 2060) TaxID=460265 RepID=B8IKA4_METNO|nr:hypothetical protein [Methylobacterium nodulans]ACL61889.1 hypothetical protein Mnod_7149 [Methylobacterium nodulans ORS 2060]